MRWLLKILAWAVGLFLGLSLLFVLLYKFVPVPVTATMLMDDNGITDDPVPFEIAVDAAGDPAPGFRPRAWLRGIPDGHIE